MPAPLLQAADLAHRFAGHWVLTHASLRLQAGETLLLTGGNGAGKTTLLRILATALRPAWGQLSIFGTDALAEPQAVRGRVGLLSHAHAMYAALSAQQNLQLVGRLMGSVAAAQITERLAEVGLGHTGDLPLHAFSAGMQRRLALARLRLLDPELLLLDEPLTQLDVAGVDLLLELCRSWRQRGRTLLICSHDLRRLGPLADRHVGLSPSGLGALPLPAAAAVSSTVQA
jgi:heme exporter protein A